MSGPNVIEQNAERVSHLAKAFSNPSRVRILHLLATGTWRINEIAETLGITYAVASQQVAVLRRLGVVAENREGLHSRYGLGDRRARLLLDAYSYIFDGADTDG